MTKDSFVAEVTFNEWGWLKNLFTFIIWLVISSSTVSFVQTLFLHIWLTSKLIIHLLSRGCLVERFNRATGLTDKSNSAINASKLLRTQLSIHLIHIVNPGKWWKDCAKLNCDIFLYFIYPHSSMIQKAPSNQSQSHIEGLQRYVKTIKLYLCIPSRPPYHCSFNGICIIDLTLPQWRTRTYPSAPWSAAWPAWWRLLCNIYLCCMCSSSSWRCISWWSRLCLTSSSFHGIQSMQRKCSQVGRFPLPLPALHWWSPI